ncbi:MAG TPA: sugar phosphate nucleotidyltransferase [Longimicrobium sp.]|nr:sugar phosphate nucleotidyltransferase [Longimicrobium sp.]
MAAARQVGPIRRAVVAAGGFGTRLLPATRAVPKVLLPVVDRPLLQYALDELAAAGFDEAAVLARADQHAIRDQLHTPEPLRQHLLRRGGSRVREVLEPAPGIRTQLVATSSEERGLGGQLAELADFVAGEPFALLFADELCDPAVSPWDGMRETFARLNGVVAAAWGADPLPDEWRVGGYQPLDDAPDADPWGAAPVPGRARLIGRYLCPPQVVGLLERMAARRGFPLGINDLLAALAEMGALSARRYTGRWWDCGSRAGYLSAVLTLALEHEALGPRLAPALGAVEARP